MATPFLILLCDRMAHCQFVDDISCWGISRHLLGAELPRVPVPDLRAPLEEVEGVELPC